MSVSTTTKACAKSISVSVGDADGVVTYYWEVKVEGEYVLFEQDGFSYTGNDDSDNGELNERKLINLDTGVYRVTIEDEGGNSEIVELELFPPYDLTIDIEFSGLICINNLNSGLALIEFENGPPPYEWTLTRNGQDVQTGSFDENRLAIQDLKVGTYQFDWIAADECTGTTTFDIVAPDNPVGITTNVKNITCPGGNDGEVELFFTGGWEENETNKNYLFQLLRNGILIEDWLEVDENHVQTGLLEGNYTVRYTDRINENFTGFPFNRYDFVTEKYNCTNEATFTITDPPAFDLALTYSEAVCQGDTNGSISISPTGGTPNYEVNLYQGHFDDPNNPVVDTNDMTQLAGSPVSGVVAGEEVSLADLSAGDYAVLLRDANGCLFAENLSVRENPLGQVNPVSDIVYCSGDLITQPFTTSEATGATRYEWTNDNTAIGLAASGAGGISFTATNTTSAPIAATVTVTPFYTNYGVECEGPTETFDITVNPEPVGVSSLITVCSDDNYTTNPQDNIDNTGNGGNGVSSSFSWEVTGITGVVTGVSLNDTNTGNIVGAVTNISGTVATVEYTVTPTATTTGCEGDTFTITVTVNPEPVGVSTIEEACSDVPFTFDPQDNINDTGSGGNAVSSSFSWEVTDISGMVTGVSDGDTGTEEVTGTLTNTSNAVATVEYTVTPTSDLSGCEGTPFTITVTINPEPVVGDQTEGPVCSDQPLGVNFNSSSSVAAATYNVSGLQLNGLTVSAGDAGVANGLTAADLADDSFTNTTNAPVDIIYTVVPVTAGGCQGNSFKVTVTVDPEPVVEDLPKTVCSNESLSLNLGDAINGVGVASYDLIDIASTGVTSSNGNITVPQTGLSANGIADHTWENLTGSPLDVVYTFVPNGSNACQGDEFRVTITVNPQPVGVDTTEEVCSDVPFTFDPQDNINDTSRGGNGISSSFSWEVTDISGTVTGVSDGDTGTEEVTGTLTNTSNAVATVEYTVTPTSDPTGCEGTPFTITVTINPEPVVGEQPVGPVCSDEPLGVNFNSSSTVAAATYNVTDLQLNGLTVSGGNAMVADGLTASDLSNDSFTNTNSTSVDVVYTVVPVTAGGCEGNSFKVTVTVDPEPVVEDLPKTVCSNESLSLNLGDAINGVGVASYDLIDIVSGGLTAGAGNITVPQTGLSANGIADHTWKNLTGSPVDVVYTFVPNGSNGCEGDEFTVTITVNPQPVGVPTTEEVCSDVSFTFDPQDNINDTSRGGNGISSSFSWEVTDISGTVTGVSDGDTGTEEVTGTLTNTSNAVATVEYTVTPTSDLSGCEGTPFTITVTINPEPVVGDQTEGPVCSDQPLGVNFNSSSSVAAATYNVSGLQLNGLTVSAGDAGVANGLTAADLADDAFTNTTFAPVNVVYTAVPVTAGGCEGDPFTVTVTINPEPVVIDQVVADVCSDSSLGEDFNSSSTIAAATYNVTDLQLNGLTVSGGNAAVASGLTASELNDDSFTNTTNGALDVVYTVVPVTAEGCQGNSFKVTVTVDPEPVVIDQVVADVCSDSSLGEDFKSSSTIAAATYNVTNLQLNGLTVSGGNAAVADGLTAADLSDDSFINTTSDPVDVVYTVVPVTAGGCVGDPFSVTVTIDPEPVVSDQTVGPVCSDEPLGVNFNSSSTIAAATYNVTALQLNGLTVSSGNAKVSNGLVASDLFDDSFTNTTSTSVDVVYTVVPVTAGGCEGNPFKVTVTVYPEPVVEDQFKTVCSNDAIGVRLGDDENEPSVASYDLIDIASTGVTAVNDNITEPQTGLSANGIADHTWENLTGGPVDVVYTFVPNGSNACQGDEFRVTITVNPQPVGVDTNPSVSSDNPFSFNPQNNIDDISNGGNGVKSDFTWEITNTTGILSGASIGESGNGDVTGTVTNTSSSIATLEYTITPTSTSGCEGAPFTITVTVNPEPVILDQVVSAVCSDSPLGEDFNSSSTVAAATYNVIDLKLYGLTVSGGNAAVADGLTASDLSDDSFTNTSSAPVNVVYTVVPVSSENAEGNSFTVTATINPEPVVEDQSEVVCSNDAIGVRLEDDVNGPSVASYDLIDIVSGGLTAGAGNITVPQTGLSANGIADHTWENLTGSPVDVVYTFVPNGSNGCEGDEFTITVTVNPEPVGVSSSLEVCSAESFVINPQDNIDDVSNGGNGVESTFTWEITTATGVLSGASVGETGDKKVSGTITNTSSSIVTAEYTIIPISTSGCEGSPFTIKVTVNPEPVVSNQTLAVCSDEPLGVNFNSSRTVAAATYNVTSLELNGLTVSGSNAGEANGLVASDLNDDSFTNTTNGALDVVYTVVPVTAEGCQGNSFKVTVTVDPEPVVSDQVVAAVCSDSSLGENFNSSSTVAATTYNVTNLELNGLTVSGGNASVASGLSASDLSDDSFTNTTSAPVDVVYTVVPVTSGGCVGDSFGVTVTIEPEPVVPDQVVAAVCSDSLLGENFNSSTTVAAATYNVTNLELNGLTVSGGDAAVASGLTAADLSDDSFTNTTSAAVDVIYTVVPVTAGNCEGSPFTIRVRVNPEPVVSDQVVTACSDSPLGENFNSSSSVAAATYNVTNLELNGLTVSGGGAAVGNGLSPSDLADDSFTNITEDSIEVIYTVVPVSSEGCKGEAFLVTVIVNPEIVDNATITNISCSYSSLCGGSIELDPQGIGPFTYKWSYKSTDINAITDPTLQNQYNLCPGDYSVEITDSSGCISTFDYVIEPPNPVEFNLVSLIDISCNTISPNCDGYIELDIEGGTKPYSLKEWYTESVPGSGEFDSLVETNTNILSNACEGNYIFKLLDANGCEFTSDIYNVEDAARPIEIKETISDYNGFEVSCAGSNDGFIEVEITGGTGSFSYVLSPGNIQDNDLSTPNILEFTNLEAANYTLQIKDDNCPDVIDLTYNLEAPSPLSSSNTQVSGPALCYGDTVAFEITASGGVPPYSGTGNYTLPAGIHSIKITDANGCETTETITVVEPSELTASATEVDPILCKGATGVVNITATGGTPPYTGVGNATVEAGEYVFTVTDANGCTFSDSIIIDEPEELQYTIDSVENPTCTTDREYDNGSICITITGGTNPVPTGSGWTSLGDGSWCLEGLSAGNYIIDVTDTNGCSSSGSIGIELTRPPEIDAYITSNVDADCSNNSIIQTNYVFVSGGVPPYEISWSGGESCDPVNPQCMETSVSGTYTAYIHDQESLANGCPPIEVDVVADLPVIGDAYFSYTSPNSNACGVLSVNEPITFNDESSGDIVDISWDFGDGSPDISGEFSPTHIFEETGTYQVELTVEYPFGCSETFTKRIEITKGYEIIMPNAFTPNGDGVNDTIRPVTLCMEEIKMSIYDTFGSLLYVESGNNDTIQGWDGTINGNPAENGNYIIVVEAISYNGQAISLNGPITLIK